MLHADADFSITVEGAVKPYNVRRVTLMKNLKLSYNLVPDGWFDFQMNKLGKTQSSAFEHIALNVLSKLAAAGASSPWIAYLPGHDKSWGFVTDFVDDPTVTCAKFTYGFKIFIFELAHLGFLGEESFETLPLLFIQVQLP